MSNPLLKSTYQGIPVEEARQLASKYAKEIVIICAWDSEHQNLHTVTYGATPSYKISAATGGEICAKALGMDLSKADFKEDFRTMDAARNAQLRDVVLRVLPCLKDSGFAEVVSKLEAAL